MEKHVFIDADRDILEASFKTSVTEAVQAFGVKFLEEEYIRTADYLGKWNNRISIKYLSMVMITHES